MPIALWSKAPAAIHHISAPAPSPQPIPAQVDCDAQQPGSPRSLGIGSRLLKSLKKSVLHDLVCVSVIACHSVANSPQESPIGFVNVRKCVHTHVDAAVTRS